MRLLIPTLWPLPWDCPPTALAVADELVVCWLAAVT
jgi:hypothetical protein